MQNVFKGPVVGSLCMDIAMKKAKENGVGWVTAKGTHTCTHTAIISYFFTSDVIDKVHTAQGVCACVCVFTACADGVSESNHFGIAGWYTMRAAEQGLVVSHS